jgi:predicted transcriptional regulator
MNLPLPSVFDPEYAAAEALAVQQGEADIAAGRVVPHAKVVEWLASWGADDELPPPTWRR